MKNHFLLIDFLFIVLCMQIVQSVYVSKEIESQTEFCLSDDIPKHTLVKVEVLVEGEFQFYFKSGYLLVFNSPISNASFSRFFTTQTYGTHHFCFINKNSQSKKVSLQISIGKQANDFGSMTDGDEFINVMRNDVAIAEQSLKDIVNKNSQGLQIIVMQSRQKYHFTNIYLFSGIFSIATIALTFIQYKYIKKYLHSRKYI